MKFFCSYCTCTKKSITQGCFFFELLIFFFFYKLYQSLQLIPQQNRDILNHITADKLEQYCLKCFFPLYYQVVNVLGRNDKILCRHFLKSLILLVQVLDSQNKYLLQMHLILSSPICKSLCGPPGTSVPIISFSLHKNPRRQTRQVAASPLCR